MRASSQLKLVWFMCLFPLMGWWMYGLFDLDEGFYGAVAREMLRRGEWITPYYNGNPWFEKPILVYWLSKPAIAAFGEMIGPRLPSVLSMAGVYAAVGWWCQRRFGDMTAILSMLVTASSLLVIAMGRMMTPDAELLLCTVVAFTTFWESLADNAKWRIWTGVALGFSVLAKGPVICFFFVLVAAWTYWRNPELRPKFKGYWLPGIALFALIVASWYVPAYMQNGRVFVDEFIIKQNIGRFGGGDKAHQIGGILNWIFYIPVLLLGMIPWSIWVVPAIRDPEVRKDPAVGYLLAWTIVVFAFFTISGTKLVHYILPAVPSLSMIVGLKMSKKAGPDREKTMWPLLWLYGATLIGIGGSIAYYYIFDTQKHVDLMRQVQKVRIEDGTFSVYRMSRADPSDLGTGQLKLQDTDHPSILYYLNKTAIQTDDLRSLLNVPGKVWILTRSDRIGDKEIQQAEQAGRTLKVSGLSIKSQKFELYELGPSGRP